MWSSSGNRTRLSSSAILWGAIALYIAAFGTLTALRHYQFQTQTGDLGVFVQTLWNTTQGRGMVNTLEELPIHHGVHLSPILFVFAPLYRLIPSPYLLLFLQTVALALGALPLYYLAGRILRDRTLALLVALAYLAYPSLHWLNLYDFHPIAFLVPLLLTALWSAETRRWTLMWIALAASAATQEDAIPVVFFAGAYIAAGTLVHSPHASSKKMRRGALVRGVAVMALALSYFAIAAGIIMPTFGGGVLRIDRYAELGETPLGVLGAILEHPLRTLGIVSSPEKLAYMLLLFVPVLFLPLLSLRGLILLMPGLLENLLTNYSPQFSTLLHYDAVVIPGILVGTIHGMHLCRARFPRWKTWGRGMFLILLATNAFVRSPLHPEQFFKKLIRPNPRAEIFRRLVALAPPDVSVAAHTHLVPHLAHRANIYFAGTEPFRVDLVLVDGADSFGFNTRAEFEAYLDRYRITQEYTSRTLQDRYLIFARNGRVSLPDEK